MSELIEYGQMIVKCKYGFVNMYRVRLYEGHEHNWHQHIMGDGKYCCPTDQTSFYGSSYERSLKDVDKIWLNSALVYERSLLSKLLRFICSPFNY